MVYIHKYISCFTGLLFLSVAFVYAPFSHSKSGEIEVLHTHNGEQFKNVFEAFSKASGIAINTTWMDRNELKARLMSGGSLARSPHIIIAPSDIIGLQDLNLAVDIDKIYKGPIPKTPKGAIIEEKMLPIYKGNHLLLYYNKQYVRQPATTWAELEALESQLSEAISVLAMPMMRMYMFAPFAAGFGETLDRNKKPNLDTPAVRRALEFTWNLEKKGILNLECDYECNVAKFLKHEAAYSITGVWDYERFSKELGDNLGVAPLPKINGTQMRSYGSYFIAIFPVRLLETQEKENINAIAEYLVSTEFQQRVFPLFKELPVLPEAMAGEGAEVNALAKTFDVTKMFPVLENPEAFWGAVFKGYVRFGSGAMTAEEASRYMQNLATEGL